ncbi:MAG: hypothetical protein IKA06_06110 [Clostridia bacterium]|nr:hypothetical protein [Clostridia bacterium]
MKENKFSFKEIKYLAFVSSILAMIFFVLTCVVKSKGLSIFFGVMAGVSLLGGCVCLYLAHRISKTHTNYFLYDRRRGITLTPDELTFAFINDNLTYYISAYAENSLDLWNGIPKNLEMAMQAEPAYRTPIAFRMLYDMSQLSENDVLALFHASDKKTVAAVCRAVKAGGDKEMADVIFEMKCDFERLQARVAPFFQKNKRCFEGRIYHYIKQHIEEFDAEKK